MTDDCSMKTKYQYGKFDYRYEEEMFGHLEEAFNRQNTADTRLLLIGNYPINGIKTNAIAITPTSIVQFIFKDYAGDIITSQEGTWTTPDGKIVEGGYGGTSPYRQACIGKKEAEKWFGRIVKNGTRIKICLVFRAGAHLLAPDMYDNQDWLDIINIDHIKEYLKSLLSESDTPQACAVDELRGELNLQDSDHRKEEELIHTETAQDYFEGLERMCQADMAIDEKYATLSQILNNAIEQKIKGISIKFSGLFSKIQYLVREYDIDKSVSIAINDARVHIHKMASIDEEKLTEYFATDLKAICKFISCIYDYAIIPNTLEERFPIGRKADNRERVKDIFGENVDYMRCTIDAWDDSYIYVTMAENGEQAKVDYTTPHKYNLNESWSYIGKLLESGETINLVKPRIKNNIIFPELIIYIPDNLVNVTAVAGCFEEYGDSYKMNLINMLKPNVCTQAILLGNFAGQLLDESSYHKNLSYQESVRRYFKKNALSFACCKDQLATFHAEAKSQKNIIEDVINNQKIHGKNGKVISSDDLMLEPSYFCEVLGLQGRMDFIHYNLDTIIEQKSGKSAWSGNAAMAKQQIKHYVQLLLYRAIFHYAYNKVDYDHMASWLFYSRYNQGLLELGSWPKLLFEAIKIRNLIVWSQKLYTQNGMGTLEDLSADKIFPNVKDELFLKWGKDGINQLLAPIHKASALEKAYYYRFLRFIANEQMLSKLGNKTKEDSGLATMWNSNLAERKQAGNIYDKLVMQEPLGEAEIEMVKFKFGEKVDQDTSNFRTGDIVVFYPYDAKEEPNVTKTVVFRGNITNIEVEHIEVFLRNGQNKNVFRSIEQDYKARRRQLVWAIEHDYMDSSYSALYKGLQAFLSANQDRKDLILGLRKPQIDTSIQLEGKYGTEEFDDLALRTKQAQDIYLIVGPPGTGKTSFGMLNVLQEHLTIPGTSILLMAYTNRAVDEICSKLVEQGLDFIRLGSAFNCNPEYREYLLDSKIEAMPQGKIEDVKNLITRSRIFCGTTTAFNGKMDIFNIKKFDLAIIDEASQILEPFILGLLSAKHVENGKQENAISKFVLIGDEKQLPAVVQQEKSESAVNEPILNEIGLTDCGLSLFERFEKLLTKTDERYCHVLTHQGRMHPEIAQFPNMAFYQNSLKIVPTEHQKEPTPTEVKGKNGIQDLLYTRRVAFLSCTPSPDVKESDKVNSMEAQMIAATVIQGYLKMKDNFDVHKSIGVIVPYRNQISTIRDMIDKMGLEQGITCLHDITIDTVERYQGSQRDLIIYGFTAKKSYQLNFLTANQYYDENDDCIIDRKLNVAMTRAKRNLVLIGYEQLLRQNIIFDKLIEYCNSIQSLFSIDVARYVKGDFAVPKRE